MKLKVCIVAFAIAGYLIIASKFSSTICLFKTITGLPCPGCGLTRAYLSLFRGNFTKAFEYHPLFLLPLVVLIILIYNKCRVNRFFIDEKVAIYFLIAILTVYILRMIFLFPKYKPMDINYDGIIPRLLKLARIT